VVVVLEGGSGGVAEGAADGIEVVHARGSGDDRIVEVVRAAVEQRPVTVVTADRGLRERVHDLGAETVGPSWLWAHERES
jgi:rRNA-processing protein FCF1